MRIFVALDIDESIRERIARFLDGVRSFAPDVRWVRPESLHVTLKFIGEKSDEDVERIKQGLSAVRAAAVSMTCGGYGFFPTAKSARVFWLGLEAGSGLADLASIVDQSTAALGVPREERPFSPHLTLARGAGGSGAPARHKGDRPNCVFQLLQDKLAALPSVDFGTMTAREFFLFQSQLGRGGSRYTKIAAYPLEAGH